MVYAFIFIFGLVFGSFFLVVGTRLPEGKSIIKPGSQCDNCHKKLAWYELIPLFSYVFLGGKCSKCHKKIGVLNPLIELFTGVLFLLSYFIFGFSTNFIISLITVSILVIIYISDFKYGIILDSPLIIGSIILVIINFITNPFITGLYNLFGALIVFAITLIIKLIGDKVFKRESLGGGDVKLMIYIGLLLGLKAGLLALVLAAFLALPYALYITIKSKEKEVPFGPFIITSAFLVFIFQTELLIFIYNLLFLNI